MLDEIQSQLVSLSNSADGLFLQKYFKTGPRQYGEGEIVAKMVKVYGAPIPQDVAKEITLYLGASYGKSSQ
jgi:hypothetical protein